jgi:hypothetical protein
MKVNLFNLLIHIRVLEAENLVEKHQGQKLL